MSEASPSVISCKVELVTSSPATKVEARCKDDDRTLEANSVIDGTGEFVSPEHSQEYTYNAWTSSPDPTKEYNVTGMMMNVSRKSFVSSALDALGRRLDQLGGREPSYASGYTDPDQGSPALEYSYCKGMR